MACRVLQCASSPPPAQTAPQAEKRRAQATGAAEDRGNAPGGTAHAGATEPMSAVSHEQPPRTRHLPLLWVGAVGAGRRLFRLDGWQRRFVPQGCNRVAFSRKKRGSEEN
jgi:hypothetical protein